MRSPSAAPNPIRVAPLRLNLLMRNRLSPDPGRKAGIGTGAHQRAVGKHPAEGKAIIAHAPIKAAWGAGPCMVAPGEPADVGFPSPPTDWRWKTSWQWRIPSVRSRVT